MLKSRNYLSLIALVAAGLLLTGFAATVLAQSQEDSAQSVAEAARRAREKKKATVKPAKTLTDDDLPKASAAGSADASATAAPAKADEAGTAQTPAAKSADAASTEKAKLENAANMAALDRAKKSLVQFESELDVMQRKEKLDSEAYYSKPDFSNDSGGKAKLDAEAQDITTKQQDIETLKARIAELQAAVDAGEPPTTENKPASEEKPPSQ